MLFKNTHFFAFAAIMVTTTFAVPILGVGENQDTGGQAEQGGQSGQGGIDVEKLLNKAGGTVNCALSCSKDATKPLSLEDCIKNGCNQQQSGDAEQQQP